MLYFGFLLIHQQCLPSVLYYHMIILVNEEFVEEEMVRVEHAKVTVLFSFFAHLSMGSISSSHAPLRAGVLITFSFLQSLLFSVSLCVCVFS